MNKDDKVWYSVSVHNKLGDIIPEITIQKQMTIGGAKGVVARVRPFFTNCSFVVNRITIKERSEKVMEIV